MKSETGNKILIGCLVVLEIIAIFISCSGLVEGIKNNNLGIIGVFLFVGLGYTFIFLCLIKMKIRDIREERE